jgi:hypothetical protein
MMTKPTISPAEQILFEKLVESIRSKDRVEDDRVANPSDASLLNQKPQKVIVVVPGGTTRRGGKYDKCEFVESLREFFVWLQGGSGEEVCSDEGDCGLYKFDALQSLFTVFILLGSFRLASNIGFMITEGFIGRHNFFVFVAILFLITSP